MTEPNPVAPKFPTEWVKLRFPVGSKVRLIKEVPADPLLAVVEEMRAFFGTVDELEVIGYSPTFDKGSAIRLGLTGKRGATFDWCFLPSWVEKIEPKLVHAPEPVLEQIPEPDPPSPPAVKAPAKTEVSWGTALAAPLTALLGLAAAKKAVDHFTKPAAHQITQQAVQVAQQPQTKAR